MPCRHHKTKKIWEGEPSPHIPPSLHFVPTNLELALTPLTINQVRFTVSCDTVREAALTVKPRNTVAVAGTRVVLRCSSDKGGNAISWSFSTLHPNCHSRRQECNLVIDSVRTSDAGAYDCSDGATYANKIAQASLIVVGNKNFFFTYTFTWTAPPIRRIGCHRCVR